MNDRAKILKLKVALRDLLVFTAGNKKQCNMCGGNGETIDYHPACACYNARKALKL